MPFYLEAAHQQTNVELKALKHKRILPSTKDFQRNFET